MKKKLADEIGKAYLRLHSKQGYQPQADKYMWTDATNKPIPTPPPPTSESNEIQTAKQLRVEVLDAIEKTWGEQAINKMLAEAVKEISMGKINIKYGQSCGDCTCVYNISIPPEMTVREFIDEWLTHKKEWGFFGIFTPDSIFGSPMCAYSQGKIDGKPLPDEVLDKKIVKATGTGGWSRSDFKFVV